jgi:hypothetical protein
MLILFIFLGCSLGLYQGDAKEPSALEDTGVNITDTGVYTTDTHDTGQTSEETNDTSFDTAIIDTADTGIADPKIEFANIAPDSFITVQSELFEGIKYFIIDEIQITEWLSEPQYFDFLQTWVQLQWEDEHFVTDINVYWDDDLFPGDIIVSYREKSGSWRNLNLGAAATVNSNFTTFNISKNITALNIKMSGSSNMLSTYAIKEIEVQAAVY